VFGRDDGYSTDASSRGDRPVIAPPRNAMSIEHLPAGSHAIEVWHPVLGKQSRDLDVRAGQTTQVVFEMKQ
jgi:hypothetical protein